MKTKGPTRGARGDMEIGEMEEREQVGEGGKAEQEGGAIAQLEKGAGCDRKKRWRGDHAE